MPDAGPKITAEELKRADPNGVTLIDVRRKPDRQQIRGAYRYDPEKLMEAEELDLPLSHDGTIVVYCGHGNSCPSIAQRLRDDGFNNAVYLEGGYEAAKAADLPLEELTQDQPIPSK
ncbi:MAG: rhodanese-like domain-containing protein [Candidatus Eremiobacteraeota bacterium]|nr:rhodanese-like domain-containing protein [Candidatus Eremiobacteraeota bacterium]